MRLGIIAFFLILALVRAHGHDFGVLYLGDSTFDKFVDGTRHALVKFDREQPSGPTHAAFKEVAQAVAEAGIPLFVIGVPISNKPYAKLNQKLAKRYKLDKLADADFPRFKLFVKGNKDTSQPLDFFEMDAPITAAALRRWAMEATGAYIGTQGQVKQMDGLAASFMAAPAPAGRQQVLEEAQAAAAALATSDSNSPDTADYAEFYVKTMQRVMAKGDHHISQESERLRQLAGDKAVAPHKREILRWRLNVLNSFAGTNADRGVEL